MAKDKSILLKVTAEEKAKIESNAADNKMTVSAWIMSQCHDTAVIGSKPIEKPIIKTPAQAKQAVAAIPVNPPVDKEGIKATIERISMSMSEARALRFSRNEGK